MKKILIILTITSLPLFSMAQGIFSMQYNMGFGVGDQGSYISSPSFRGMTFIDARWYLGDNVTLGGSISWNVFYENETGTFDRDNTTVSGEQFRTINAFPLLLSSFYYWGDDGEITFYAGGGMGGYSIEKKTSMGLWAVVDDNWHFGIAPEVGVLFPMSGNASFLLSARYNHAFKTSGSIDYQYFGVNVGFAWY